MPRRLCLWLLPIVFALACTPTAFPVEQPQEPPAGEVLYLQEGGKLRVRSGATGEIQAEVPDGLVSADWKTVYTLAKVAPESRTTVHAMDLFGDTMRSIDLPGEYRLPTVAPGRHAGLSADGKTLVLHQAGGRLIRIDTATGAIGGDLTPRPWSPLAILRAAAAP